MPTGSGKTLIAAKIMKLASRKCIFLVPRCDLVSQQAKAIQQWSQKRVSTFMGSLSVPAVKMFDIMVSTPVAFQCLQMRDERFDWTLFEICVFDEVHHVLKDHPYRHIARGIRTYVEQKNNSKNNNDDNDDYGGKVQVIGLSASLTYAVQKDEVQKSLRLLSQDLMLDDMIMVHDDELRDGGYNPPSNDGLEIVHPHVSPEGVLPFHQQKPHLMHGTFFMRASCGQLTVFADYVSKVVKGIEMFVISAYGDTTFKSPLNNVSLSSWETYTHKLALKFPGMGQHLNHLENWYVALRILVQTWEEEQELVLNWLKINNAFDVKTFVKGITDEIDYIEKLIQNPFNFSKITCLKTQLLEKKQLFGPDFRALVFVQQRITAYILAHIINRDSDLLQAGISSDYVAARSAKITPKINVTPSAAAACINKFRNGDMNVIVATQVIEEGFDVPASNVVISFDHIKNTVELAQRFGRARQTERRIVIMDERRDRPICFLKKATQTQNSHISDFSPEDVGRNAEAEKAAQRDRERNARSILFCSFDHRTALQVLNEYTKKTKATVTDHHSKDKSSNEWVIVRTYTSILRRITSEGRAQSKITANRICTLSLLKKLQISPTSI